MSGKLFRGPRGGFRGLTVVLFGAVVLAAPVRAQTVTTPANPYEKPAAVPASPIPTEVSGGGVQQVGCAACSSGLLGAPAPILDVGTVHTGCGDGCGGPCYPGRKPCDCCCCGGDNCFGRMLCGVYQCICCPDPCYEPHWVALADNAFWQDGPRPMTQMKLVYQQLYSVEFPDKAEIFEARFNEANFKFPLNGKQVTGPIGKNLLLPNSAADIGTFYMINEAAVGNFGLSVALPYDHVGPDGFVAVPGSTGGAAVGGTLAADPTAATSGASGFGDMIIGTKSMVLDCELIQVTFQFKTFVPTGNFTKGLGTGHVSLEPALLMALKLTPEMYLQTELAYRFPIGGDALYEGPMFHYHLSLNRILWCCGHDVQVVGSAELNGYEITGGAFTDPTLGSLGIGLPVTNIGSIVDAALGVRLVICDKIDFGVSAFKALTENNLGSEGLRAEFRWRF